MLRTGGKRDGSGRSRTRAFRQSFLLAYAIRIGERLAEAADHAEQAAVAEQRARGRRPRGRNRGDGTADGVAARKGADLVPFLAARHRAVDEAVDEMFGSTLTRSRSVRATDAEGWDSGRAAADLASLRNQAQVVR